MAAKGLANIYSHNRPMDSWEIVFLALQLETRVTAAPQQTGEVHPCQSSAVRAPGDGEGSSEPKDETCAWQGCGSARAGDFPETPSASSLLSYLGLSGSYGSALCQPLAAPRLPHSGQGDVTGI